MRNTITGFRHYTHRLNAYLLRFVLAALVIVNPVTCYSQQSTPDAKKCCASRHCDPKSKRECCKVKLFGDGVFTVSAAKTELVQPAIEHGTLSCLVQGLTIMPSPSSAHITLQTHSPPSGLYTLNHSLRI